MIFAACQELNQSLLEIDVHSLTPYNYNIFSNIFQNELQSIEMMPPLVLNHKVTKQHHSNVRMTL